VANWLKNHLSQFIDRKVRTGAKDTGDIANVRTIDGKKVAVEVKDYGGRLKLGPWIQEAHEEMRNDGAAAGIIIAKRMNTTRAGDFWCVMTVDDLIVLLGGERPTDG
jgi:hypothetical protein